MDQRQDMAQPNEERHVHGGHPSRREHVKVASYMSLAFYHMIAKWGRLAMSIRTDGKGALHAVSLLSNNPTPMQILGSTYLPLRFPPETRVRRIKFGVVGGFSYGLIVGVDYLRNKESIFDFRPGKGARTHLGHPF